jgi:hypothetical protein
MAQIRQLVLILALAGALCGSPRDAGPRFLPDDPIRAMPPPMPVRNPAKVRIGQTFDFLVQSSRRDQPPPIPAGAINTIGEVPDSEWFTNRQGTRRLSRGELQRGSTSMAEPVPPFTVTSGKREGITPGFVMRDSKGNRYFVKCDPMTSPELASAADVIVSKFLYAIGYNTPKNSIVNLRLSDLRISGKATITLPNRRTRAMTWSDLKSIVQQVAHRPDGSFRVVASLAIEGENVGPFRYEGMRADDPNDIVPHENRRDLRGLYVFFAWLNNTDAKASNTLDTVVEQNGIHFIRHYLIDFGSALGSDGFAPKDPRFGHEYMLATPTDALKQILTLGVIPAPWERAHFPDLPALGNFESRLFDPDGWKPDYPNPAFISRLPDDDYWAAKQVMAFTDDDIRAIVETAQFSDPRSTKYMITTLSARRDKIGRAFFSKILPLDHFRVENGELLFDDLAVRYGFYSPRQYDVRWYRFDNISHSRTPIPSGGTPAQLPAEARQAASGSYFSTVVTGKGSGLKPVSIYLRKEGSNYKVVGIDRNK